MGQFRGNNYIFRDKKSDIGTEGSEIERHFRDTLQFSSLKSNIAGASLPTNEVCS